MVLQGVRPLRVGVHIGIWSVLAVFTVLTAIEGVLRVPAVITALPVRTHFQQPGVVRRLEALERLIQDQPRVDILFVGSSIVRCNIHPIEFDRSMAALGMRAVSFNVGLSGLWPGPVEFYLEHLWLPTARPRVVVQGIRYGELQPSSRTRKEQDIYRGPVESRWRNPTTLNRIEATLLQRIHLLQYRGALPRWLLAHRRGMPGEDADDDPRVITDPRGWTPRLPTLDVVRARGWVAAERPYSGELSAESRQAFAAIRASARQAHAAGARYVLVNVPEHSYRWSAPDGPARYRAFIQTMAQLARDEEFEFIDVTESVPNRFANEADYSDYHHMSPAGAIRFTHMLAQEFVRESRTHAEARR
jgi:hypothetical protein